MGGYQRVDYLGGCACFEKNFGWRAKMRLFIMIEMHDDVSLPLRLLDAILRRKCEILIPSTFRCELE